MSDKLKEHIPLPEWASTWMANLLRQVKPDPMPDPALRKACVEACSVHATFPAEPVRTVNGLIPVEGARAALEYDSVEVPTLPGTSKCWALNPESRAEGLDSLGTLERMWEVRQWNDWPATEPIQAVFDEYLRRDYSAASSSDPARLEAAMQVTQWLARFDAKMPPAETVDRNLSRRNLLSRMERLTAGFMGRDDELAELRTFVGILEPRTPLESMSRFLRKLVTSETKAPLLIYGIGGIGKSTLIAEFIRQHASSEVPFPYVYLDFDNPRLNVRNLSTLVDEMADQLVAQYPGSEWTTVRNTAIEVSALTESSDTDTDSPDHSLVFTEARANVQLRSRGAERVATDFESSLIRAMELSELERMLQLASYLPFLLVLDTFEEVQKRGIEMASILWEFLTHLQRRFPRTRIVVAGRALIPELNVNGKTARNYPLRGFDAKSAVALLQSAGVTDPELAETLFNQVGGNPLSLKLAGQVAAKEKAGKGGIENLKTTSYLIFSAAETVIQGQLYRRILGRIGDPDLKQLAHPGLVVRRLTPEVIQKVLAIPCGLGEITDDRAQTLFAELRKQVDLVTVEPDGALRHQQDIRRVMLKLLEDERRDQVDQIHKAAFEYYLPRVDSASRIERIYALQLGKNEEEIRSLWWPDAAESLLSSIDELPPASQLVLTLITGRSADADLRKLADLDQWERIVEAKCRQEIRYGNYASAEKLLAERAERAERTQGSALYALEATVCLWEGKPDKAMQLVLAGIDSAQSVNRLDRLVELWRLRGDILVDKGERAEGDVAMRTAQQLAHRIDSSVLELQIFAARARYLPEPPVDELNLILMRVTDTDFASVRLQIRGLFQTCGTRSDVLLYKGLRALKLRQAVYALADHPAYRDLIFRMEREDRVNEVFEKLLDWGAGRTSTIRSEDERRVFEYLRHAPDIEKEMALVRRVISQTLEEALNPNMAARSA
jgi:cellulose synthase operon protein C